MCKRQVDAGRLVIGAAQRLDDQQIRVVGRQHDPVAAAKRNQFAGLEGNSHRTFLKIDPDDVRPGSNDLRQIVFVVVDPHLVAARHDRLPFLSSSACTAGSSCGVPSQKTQMRGS